MDADAEYGPESAVTEQDLVTDILTGNAIEVSLGRREGSRSRRAGGRSRSRYRSISETYLVGDSANEVDYEILLAPCMIRLEFLLSCPCRGWCPSYPHNPAERLPIHELPLPLLHPLAPALAIELV